MDIVNFPNGFRPQGADFLKRQENAAADFARLRVSAGRGVAQGLTLTRQADGAVVLSGGHGNDALGNAIVVRLAETLDLSSAGLSSAGKYRWIAVVLHYEQAEQGQAAGVGDVWAERLDSYRAELILGDETSKESDALRPQNDGAGLLVGDILFDDNGTRSADSARADQGLKRRLEALGSQEWRPFCDYPLGNICLHEGILYLCTRGHTSGQANAPGQSSAPWAKLVSDQSIAAAIAKAEANAKSDASNKNDSLESSLKRLINQAEQSAKSDASSKDRSLESSLKRLISEAESRAKSDASSKNDSLESSLKRLISQAEQSAKSDASSKDRSLESSLKRLINQAKREAKRELYPIGSIYFNYNNRTNPASLLGFGTWTALPVNYFLAQAGSRYVAGGTYSEGLPNIKGVVGASTRDYMRDFGAFSYGLTRDWMFDGGGSMMKDRSHDFDASRSSTIYGRHGDRVQPFTLGAYMWRRIA